MAVKIHDIGCKRALSTFNVLQPALFCLSSWTNLTPREEVITRLRRSRVFPPALDKKFIYC